MHKLAALFLALSTSCSHCTARIKHGADLELAPVVHKAVVQAEEASTTSDAELVGEVDGESLGAILNVIGNAPKGGTIRLFVSSPGGDGIATLRFLELVRQAKEEKGIRLECRSGMLVASAAAIIFEAACDARQGDEGTIWLFHGVASQSQGKVGNVEDDAALMRALDHSVAVLVAPHLHMTVEQYLAWIEGRDRWLTTEQLRKMGGCD